MAIRLILTMSRESVNVSDSDSKPDVSKKAKRKRLSTTEAEELEIDLNQPEPPSKKTKRLQKRAERQGKVWKAKPTSNGDDKHEELEHDPAATTEQESALPKRSEWSVWIGNLTWTTSKDDLRDFFSNKGNISRDHITRLHMPPPPEKGPAWKGPKPLNKGFAYVDFLEEEEMKSALQLSEQLLSGRKVLIKNAKSFEGRPEVAKVDTENAAQKSAKEPSKRVFVGGLPFEVTREELQEHFAQAGEVEDVFMATFEDTGKCKGFGFIRFSDLDAAQAAVQGYVYKERDEDDSDDSDDDQEDKSKKRPGKRRKWYINRLHGRALRCEFAEDAQSRYKKRFNKERTEHDTSRTNGTGNDAIVDMSSRPGDQACRRPDKDERQAQRRKKHEDARHIAPGKALANAKRATAAIVTAVGKKTTFD